MKAKRPKPAKLSTNLMLRREVQARLEHNQQPRVPPLVDADVFRPGGPHNAAAPRRAVGVGRFVAQKGFDTLLRAWRQVVDRMPGATAAPPSWFWSATDPSGHGWNGWSPGSDSMTWSG